MLNEKSATLSVIDTATDSRQADIPAASGHAGIATGGGRVYVTDGKTGRLLIIDTATGKAHPQRAGGALAGRRQPVGRRQAAGGGGGDDNSVVLLDAALRPQELAPTSRCTAARARRVQPDGRLLL